MAVLMFRHAAQFLGIYPMGIVESPVVFGCGQNQYIISRSIRHRRKLSPRALPSCHGPASISRDVRQYWLNYAALPVTAVGQLAILNAIVYGPEFINKCQRASIY